MLDQMEEHMDEDEVGDMDEGEVGDTGEDRVVELEMQVYRVVGILELQDMAYKA